jgi:peroxiredoxin
LADYRNCEAEIRSKGAKLVAISVDSPEKSQAVREELHLNFPILCDAQRQVVREWGVYNAREKGGIAKPAVFIIDPGRSVRYASVDEIASRVRASDIASLLAAHDGAIVVHRHPLVPGPRTWVRAVRNSIHYGVREPASGSK